MGYYIEENGTPTGPYELSDPKLLGISDDTLVWTQGMNNWQPAGTVAELVAAKRATSAQSSVSNTTYTDDNLYYIMQGSQQVGPYPVSQLLSHGLTPTTYVWTEGMEQWLMAQTQPQLQPLFSHSTSRPGTTTPPQIKKYYMAVNNAQQGPYSINELVTKGLTAETLVWTEGMLDWQPAGTIAELQYLLQQGSSTYFAPQERFASDQSEWVPKPDNYKTLNVVFLVVSICLCNVITLVLSILGMNKAKKSDLAYLAKNSLLAQSEADSARTFAIISAVIIALQIGGIIFSFLDS